MKKCLIGTDYSLSLSLSLWTYFFNNVNLRLFSMLAPFIDLFILRVPILLQFLFIAQVILLKNVSLVVKYSATYQYFVVAC